MTKDIFDFDADGMIVEKEVIKVEQSVIDSKEVFVTDGYYFKTVKKGKNVFELNLGLVLVPLYIVRNEFDEYAVAFKYLSQGKSVEFLVDFEDVSSNDFYTVCAKYGYLVSSKTEERMYFKDLIVSYVSYLKENSVHRITKSQLGWDGDSFYIGDKIISPKGISQYILRDHKNTFKDFHAKGTKEKFDEALKIFGMKGFEKQKYYYLMGVSSPLLSLNKLSGVCYNINSNEPGTCKSLTQYMIALTYGSKSQVMLDFTSNSVFAKLGEIKNLPVIIEEVSDKLKDPKSIKGMNDIIYYITGEKTKSRALQNGDSSGSKEFCSSAGFSSNGPMENIIINDSTAIAKFARLFEFSLGNKKYTAEETSNFADGYLLALENYGFGMEWLKVVVDNKEVFTNELKVIFKKYQALFVDSGFRFLANHFACATLMAKILRMLGYSQFDEVETFEFFKAEIPYLISRSKEKKVDALSILENFLNSNKGDTKYVRKMDNANKLEVLNEFENDNYTARVNKTSGELCVNISSFNKFLQREYQINNFNSLKIYFEELGYIEKSVKINEVGCNMKCYVFTLPREYMIDEETQAYLKLVDKEISKEEIDNLFKDNYKL